MAGATMTTGEVMTGTVLRFDDNQGYGFIAPDDDGPDVFMHANDLLDDKRRFRTGVEVEFTLLQGERGPKAAEVVLAGPSGHGDWESPDAQEFRTEVTDALIAAAPDMTAGQLGAAREALIDIAAAHGWIDR